MANRIDSVEKISVTTTAKDVAVSRRSFLIENLDETNNLYIKEKDGEAVTANNSFVIPPKTLFDVVLSANVLSVKGEASLDARLLYVTEDF